MDLNDYQPMWDRVEPLMRAKLDRLKEALTGRTDCAFSEVYQSGDEEFRLTLDLRRGDITVLGLDFILLDAEANGEEEPGFGIKLDFIGYGGLSLGFYAPHNYTAFAFTQDASEVVSRVEALHVDAVATYIIESALTDERLLKELAGAQ